MNKTLSQKIKLVHYVGTQLVNLNDIIPDKSILLPTREILLDSQEHILMIVDVVKQCIDQILLFLLKI